jgi:succinoglycan biosynthesis transport protein ExoP
MLKRSTEADLYRYSQPRPAQGPRGGSEADIFRDVLACVKRNLRFIAATTIIGTAITLALVFSITPKYQASVLVLVDPRMTKILQDAEVVGRTTTDNAAIESEVELIQSQAISRKVAEKLRLQDDPEFAGPSGIIGTLKAALIAPIRNLFGSREDGDPFGSVVETLEKSVSAKRRGLTFVMELNAWSQDARKSALLANTFAEVYIAEQIAAKQRVTQQASRWLNERVDEMRGRVKAADQALEKYKAEQSLFDPGGETLSTRQISNLNDQLVNARALAAAARSKYELLKQVTPDRLRSAAASADVLQSPVVSNLRGQYSAAAQLLADRNARYGAEHPQVVTARAQVADIERQISAEISRIVTSAENEYRVAKSREESLVASLDELKEKAGEYNQASVRLRELERDAQANRDLFQSFLGRAKQTAELSLQVADSRVVSAAAVPIATSYPKRALMIGLGFFGTLGLGIALALARDSFRSGFRHVLDIENMLGVPPLATIPMVPAELGKQGALPPGQPRILQLPSPDKPFFEPQFREKLANSRKLASLVVDDPDSVFTESVRSLHFALKRQAAGEPIGVIMVTSALPGEGKSTIAASLARIATEASDRVLLVDGDLRQPSIADVLGLPGDTGLQDLLRDSSDLADCVQYDERTELYVVGGYRRVPGREALRLLSSKQMDRFLRLARASFDLVVVDASPLLPVADPRALVDYVDGVVLVVASMRTPKDAVETALRESPGLQEKLAGVVLNGAADDVNRYYRERYYTHRNFELV